MPVGKFAVGDEAVRVDYELMGPLVGTKTGTMKLMDSPLGGISRALLHLTGGNLITEDGQVYFVELTKCNNGLSADFIVVPARSR